MRDPAHERQGEFDHPPHGEDATLRHVMQRVETGGTGTGGAVVHCTEPTVEPPRSAASVR